MLEIGLPCENGLLEVILMDLRWIGLYKALYIGSSSRCIGIHPQGLHWQKRCWSIIMPTYRLCHPKDGAAGRLLVVGVRIEVLRSVLSDPDTTVVADCIIGEISLGHYTGISYFPKMLLHSLSSGLLLLPPAPPRGWSTVLQVMGWKTRPTRNSTFSQGFLYIYSTTSWAVIQTL